MGIKLKEYTGRGPRGGRVLVFLCPGCKCGHPYEVDCADKGWTWNGSMEAPTFKPSLLVNEHTPERRCHLFVTDGKIQFLPDCYHELKGQTIEMQDFDDDLEYARSKA